MTPEEFVRALKAQVQESAASEIAYYRNPALRNPPEHLNRFSKWFRQLSESDQQMVTNLVTYAKEGGLFTVLTFLDNLAFLTDKRGTFEVFHADDQGNRVRLNQPNGELLTDIFNNEG